MQRALTMELLVQQILRQKIWEQDYHSNDDVSVMIGSDSDSLEAVEKRDFVEFLDDSSSTSASERDFNTT